MTENWQTKVIVLFHEVIQAYKEETRYHLSDYTSSPEQQKTEEEGTKKRIRAWKEKLAALLPPVGSVPGK